MSEWQSERPPKNWSPVTLRFSDSGVLTAFEGAVNMKRDFYQKHLDNAPTDDVKAVAQRSIAALNDMLDQLGMQKMEAKDGNIPAVEIDTPFLFNCCVVAVHDAAHGVEGNQHMQQEERETRLEQLSELLVKFEEEHWQDDLLEEFPDSVPTIAGDGDA